MTGLDNASIQFIAFGLAVALIMELGRSPRWRHAVLLVASLLSIALLTPDLIALVPLAGFLLLGYLAVLAVRNGVPRAPAICVILIVGVYVWLKQYSFLPAGSFLKFPYSTLGLSYVFFRVLHLVIEAVQPGPARGIGAGRYLTYTLNFTTFVSGPIQRYEDFEQEEAKPAPLDMAIVGEQIERIIRGFFKVNVLALLFRMVHDDAFAALAQPLSHEEKIFAFIRIIAADPLFLYCNFSGYIDIVIALARLMRIRLPENFDRPFSAASFIDFWNRWHITLSSWLKTYVYNPLLIAMMRRNRSKALEPVLGVVCFFVTFFLIGIWHGRTSEFAFFGVLQGTGVALNKSWQLLLINRFGRKKYRQIATSPVYTAIARGLTFSWFALTMIWFWADWQQIALIRGAVGIEGWLVAFPVLAVAATLVLSAWETLRSRLFALAMRDVPLLTNRYARTAFTTAMLMIAFIFVAVLSQPAPGIVYRTF